MNLYVESTTNLAKKLGQTHLEKNGYSERIERSAAVEVGCFCTTATTPCRVNNPFITLSHVRGNQSCGAKRCNEVTVQCYRVSA